MRDELLQLLAELEAGLDFVEEDIEFVSAEQIVQRLAVRRADADGDRRPNGIAARDVSRSSKSCFLASPTRERAACSMRSSKRYGCRTGTDQPQSPAALVSPQRGTTRDYLTATISLDGIPCEIVDTAGIDEASTRDTMQRPQCGVRSQLIRQPKSARRQRHLAERSANAPPCACYCIEAPMRQRIGDHLRSHRKPTDCDVLVLTKGDLLRHPTDCHRMPVEQTTGCDQQLARDGTRRAVRHIAIDISKRANRATWASCRRDGEPLPCEHPVGEDAVTRAIELASAGMGNELIAVELRTALHELGKVVGAVYTDDLLDRIFSKFCIGK